MAVIEADLTDGYVVLITNGRHQWQADEPGDVGGTDTGPTPYEMLLGSLAIGSVGHLALTKYPGLPYTEGVFLFGFACITVAFPVGRVCVLTMFSKVSLPL